MWQGVLSKWVPGKKSCIANSNENACGVGRPVFAFDCRGFNAQGLLVVQHCRHVRHEIMAMDLSYVWDVETLAAICQGSVAKQPNGSSGNIVAFHSNIINACLLES